MIFHTEGEMESGAEVIRKSVRDFILQEFLEGEDDSRLTEPGAA